MSEINEKMSFEEAYTELQRIVALLENPDNKMEESIELYERACQLVIFCRKKLDKAKVRIIDINDRIAQLNDSAEG